MILLVVLILICVAVEVILGLIFLSSRYKKRIRIRKSLYRLIEKRVLEQSLRYKITSGQAAMYEKEKRFLYVEFQNTKPLLSYIFLLDEWITIGRNKENKICICNETFSRMHCKIGMIGNVMVLQDLGSANGTTIRRGLFEKINVASGKREVVQSGDCIQIGKYRMKIQMLYGKEAFE